MTSPLRVIVNGAFGKVGSVIAAALAKQSDFKVVAQLGRQHDLNKELKQLTADIVIDFTEPDCAYENVLCIIEAGKHPVIGTTGFSTEQIQILQQQCREKKLGGVIAPNFSIGAILTMHLATIAAQFFSSVEIIEMHHAQKKDAPSGTAIKTANMIAEHKKFTKNSEKLAASRGQLFDNIPIHSIRLPGLLAHEQVIFGNIGETLTIKHDTINRECFVPGVILACKKVVTLNELVYGMEQLLL